MKTRSLYFESLLCSGDDGKSTADDNKGELRGPKFVVRAYEKLHLTR